MKMGRRLIAAVAPIGFSTSNFQQTTDTLTETTNPFGLAVSPNGNELYVASQGDNKVYVYSTAGSGSLIKSIKARINPADIAFTPNGDVAYVTNLSSSTVSVISVATNKIKGSPISLRRRERCLACEAVVNRDERFADLSSISTH